MGAARVSVARRRASGSTPGKSWSLGTGCPSFCSSPLATTCAQSPARTIPTRPAAASSRCPCRSLNWVSARRRLTGRAEPRPLNVSGLRFSPVHFEAYRPAFIGQYCRASALLELESLLSQQALREAFSQDELAAAKRQQRRLQERLQVRKRERLTETLGAESHLRFFALLCFCSPPANGGGVA